MEAPPHWLTDVETRAKHAEKLRDEAEAKAAALQDRLAKVEQIVQEQQDAIEEMHSAWLAAKGGGGGGYAGGHQDELLQLQAEIEDLHAQLAHGAGVNDSPAQRQAYILRAEQAEGRADALERKVEQLLAQASDEREQQLRMQRNTASQVVLQRQRISELEGLKFEHEQQIAKLQVAAAGVEAAKAEKQVLETEKKSLLKRVMDAERQVLHTEERAKKETADVASALTSEKEVLRQHLTEEFSKEYSALNERFEREYAAVRQRVAKAELDAQTAAQKATTEAKEREVAVKRLEESEAAAQKQKAELETSKGGADQRLKRLSNHELQALQQRLNAAEARAGTAESKRKEFEQELAGLRKEKDRHLEEAREAQQERAQAVEALEAARVAREGQMAEATRRVSSLAVVQQERDVLREQLAQQKRNFERELEDVRSEMKQCEEALALSAPGTSSRREPSQRGAGIDHSRRSAAQPLTIAPGSSSVSPVSPVSPVSYAPQGRVAPQTMGSANVGRSPSLVLPNTASITVPTMEVQTLKSGVAVLQNSTPTGSSRFEMPTAVGPRTVPLTPVSHTK